MRCAQKLILPVEVQNAMSLAEQPHLFEEMVTDLLTAMRGDTPMPTLASVQRFGTFATCTDFPAVAQCHYGALAAQVSGTLHDTPGPSPAQIAPVSATMQLAEGCLGNIP